MRNLYKRLGISDLASQEEISQAIRQCSNDALRIDASEVLLNTNRKKSYDKIHRTLDDIGGLRASLGLNNSDNWIQGSTADYTKTPESSTKKDKVPLHKRDYSNNFLVNMLIKTIMFFVDLALGLIQGIFEGILEVIVRLIPLALIGALIFGAIHLLDDGKKSSSVSKPRSTFNEPIIATPYNGKIRKWVSSPSVAPLSINTSSGSNYLVKLVDTYTGEDVMDIFIHGGSNIEVEVPLGNYHIKYASGETWYGYQYYFGPETGYSKAESIFRFKDTGYQVTGYTLTLYRVTNGNLRTKGINKSQF